MPQTEATSQPQSRSALSRYNTQPLPPVRGGRGGGAQAGMCATQTSAAIRTLLVNCLEVASHVFKVAEVTQRVCTQPSEVGNPVSGDVAATSFDLFRTVLNGKLVSSASVFQRSGSL